ncbi:MAG: hypothetical protein A2057_16740 [Ignavibacteria bacterium GWA2_35_9]|nr:MAG: hypothetical protein A2057_16740 [Ignavibacteria bacterium GWA2_35_9]OGU44956.1 MAG: hypothetical protein A2000_00090 [Ignavibacteria bacterium GWB2_36_8]OGU48801.1 MAG: hypothetical protein A2080_03445 [Ignavibacteria bacterium GWC2_36_12]
MERDEILGALEPVIKTFDELGILYYIGGSIASSAYGMPRTTLDVDLVTALTPLNITPLVDKLKEEYFIDAEMINDALITKTSFNILHLKTMLKIDVFILKDKPYQQKAFERKIKDRLEEKPDALSVYLCSPEDVIINKLEWYKSGGEISERQWLDILGVIKVQGNSLDKEYLTKWSKELGVEDLLKKSFNESNLNI